MIERRSSILSRDDFFFYVARPFDRRDAPRADRSANGGGGIFRVLVVRTRDARVSRFIADHAGGGTLPERRIFYFFFI